MKRENIKPSLLAYYLTRSSLLHPILAITQVNIGIYLLFAAPYINTRFETVAAPMFFRQLCCLFFFFIFAILTKKFTKSLTPRDFKYCIMVGFIGVSIAQYFQLQNFKTLLYQSGVHRLAIWQPIVPVMVTFISMLLKLEKGSFMRYLAIIVDFSFMVIVLILRIFFIDEYGENTYGDKRYLLYIVIVITSGSVQFVLTKRLFSRSKINLAVFAFWVYFFGIIGTSFLYVIECFWRGAWTIESMPLFLSLVEEVIGVLMFSCLNEVANYILLLYFIKKTLVTKASVYGVVGPIFIIFESLFYGKIRSVLLGLEIGVFLFGYFVIFLEKKREKRITKHKADVKHVKYIRKQSEEEIHKLYHKITESRLSGHFYRSQANSPKNQEIQQQDSPDKPSESEYEVTMNQVSYVKSVEDEKQAQMGLNSSFA